MSPPIAGTSGVFGGCHGNKNSVKSPQEDEVLWKALLIM